MTHRRTYQDKALTHVYVRDFQKSIVRPCWASSDEIYCGICMRGTVQAVEGSECRYCYSTVARVLGTGPPSVAH